MLISHSFLTSKAQIKKSSIVGKGIFAKKKIKKGELICIWDGDLANEKMLKLLSPKEQSYALQIYDNFWYVTFNRKSLEATDFFNHSCDPNIGIKGQVVLVAIRDIKPGEEITFDYSFTEADPKYKFECYCGAKNCRKTVTGNDWKIPGFQKKYFDYFSSYIQEKIKKTK